MEKGRYCTPCRDMLRGHALMENVEKGERAGMHHESMMAFKAAKDQGCRMCSKLWQRLFGGKAPHEIDSDGGFLAFRLTRTVLGEPLIGLRLSLFTPFKARSGDYTMIEPTMDPLNPGHPVLSETVESKAGSHIAHRYVLLFLAKTCQFGPLSSFRRLRGSQADHEI